MRTRNKIAAVLAVMSVSLVIIYGTAHAAGSTPTAGPQPSNSHTANVILLYQHSSIDYETGEPTGPMVTKSQVWDNDKGKYVDCDPAQCGSIVIHRVHGVRKAYLRLISGEEQQFSSVTYMAKDRTSFNNPEWDGKNVPLRKHKALFTPYKELYKIAWIDVNVYSPNYPEPSWATTPPCTDISCGKGGAA